MIAAPQAGPVAELQHLRIRLATLLGGIEDLELEPDTTVELARHLRTQHRRHGQRRR